MKLQARSACLLACLLCSGCHQLPPPTPLDQLTPAEAQGHAEFNAHCALCHNERVNEAKNGPSLRGVLKKPYLPSGAPANEDRITATIIHGHGLMPPQNVDDTQIAAILAYLHTV